jgi:hypothetical protein
MTEQNNGSLRSESEVRFQDFKLCKAKFATFILLFNFDVKKADEDVQMELGEMQCDSILKQNLSEDGMSDF